MKKLLITIIITLSFLGIAGVKAQSPQAIPYQAVARTNTGNLIAAQTVAIRFSIHDATAGGAIVYQEVQHPTTNALGLFSVNIGEITPASFALINWGNGAKFMQVELDVANGVAFVDMGTQQMMSVPYALSAANGNWNKTGNDIINSNSGKVGIGTSSLYEKLNIGGTTALDDYNIYFRNNGDHNHGLGFYGWNSVNGFWDGYNVNGPVLYGNSGGVLGAYDNGQINVLTWRANGNVGIGTSDPTVKLDVMGDIALNNQKLLLRNGADNNYYLNYNNIVDGPNLVGNGGGVLSTSNGLSVLYWGSNGNVGIGTITPSATLDVVGATKTTNFQMTSGAGADKVLTSDASGNASWQTPASGTVTGTGTATRVAFWDGTSSLSSNSNLNWDNTNSRLGIGNSAPENLLHVGNGGPDGKVFIDTRDNVFGQFQIGNRANNSEASMAFISGASTFGSGAASVNGDDHVWVIGTNVWGIDGTKFGIANKAAAGSLFTVTSAGDVGIGNTSPSEKLDVAGKTKTASFQMTSGANTNYVLTSDASGNASWTAPASDVTLTAIGASPNANGASLSGQALTLQPADVTNGGVVTTDAQTFAGAKSFNTDANINGLTVGRGNGNDVTNTAIGYYSLSNNTSGFQNTSCGFGALSNNSSGGFNCAIGQGALENNNSGNENTSIGTQTMSFNTNGSGNTACGLSALQINSTGNDNTAFGRSALTTNTVGSNNTALGYNAGTSANNLNNATAIGNGASVNASNKIRLGNTSVNVIEGQVAYTFPSDARFKDNVKEDVKGLDFIMKLKPVTYNFNRLKFAQHIKEKTEGREAELNKLSAIRSTGFLAQDVERVVNETGFTSFDAVHAPTNETDNYSLGYAEFVVPLVKAVQEQQAQIDELKAENAALSKSSDEKLKALEAKINLLMDELTSAKK